MAKNTYGDWDSTAGNNLDIGGISIAEGCPAGNINNGMREIMAQLASFEVVGRTETQTLTNKTLTSPAFTDPTMSDPTVTGELTVEQSGDRDLILENGNINWGTVGQDFIDFLNNGGLRVYEDGVFKARIGTGDTTLIQSVYDNTTASVANVNVNSFGAIRQSTSSGEYKINRAPVDGNVILALEPVSFESTHKDDADLPRMAGFIAEDVATAFPEASADGGKNYDVRAIVAALVALAQRQERRIRALEAGV